MSNARAVVVQDAAGAWWRAAAALAWIVGVAAQLQQPALWAAEACPLIGAAALAGLLAARRSGWRPLLWLAVAAAGFAWAGWRAQARLADALAPAWEGCDVEVVGVIDDMPQVAEDGEHFAFVIESARALAMSPRALRHVQALDAAAGHPLPAAVARAEALVARRSRGPGGGPARRRDGAVKRLPGDDAGAGVGRDPLVSAGGVAAGGASSDDNDDNDDDDTDPHADADLDERGVASLRPPPRDATPGVPSRVWLSWSRNPRDDRAVAASPAPLRAGQRWRLPVRLRRPHGALNPDGFDAELWLFDQDLRATGTVRGNGELLGASWALVANARQWVRDRLLLSANDGGNAASAGALAALAVGDQAAIDGPGWEVFRDTGVAHLMSISGLHITMLAWLAGGAVGALWRRSEAATLWLPTPLAARWGGVAFAWGYALLAGWGVPAQRTVLMLAATAGLRSAGLDWPASLVALAAMVPVTLLDPWALLQPGFWLSFAAVGLLMVSEPARADGVVRAASGDRVAAASATAVDAGPADARPGGSARGLHGLGDLARRLAANLRGGLRAQVVASVGLAPLSLVAFQQVSLVGLVANLLAEPWVTLVVTPLALLGIVLPPLWTLAALALRPLLALLAWLARWPLASVHVATAPDWALAAGLAGGALLMLPLPWRVRALGAALLPPLLWPFVARPAPGRFEVVAADVGQGSAVLVRTHAHLLLFDTGPRFGPTSDAGKRMLLPLLWARGEPRIDVLVLSHADADHVSGAQSLIDRLPVLALRSSLAAGNPLRANPLPHVACLAGQRWTWDGVRFTLLHPFPADYRPGARTNALSCVLRVVGADGASALLTGDVEAAGEARLVARAAAASTLSAHAAAAATPGGIPSAPPSPGGAPVRPLPSGPPDDARLRSDVLLVPHHGSRTSSTDAFLDAVRPRVAVIQVGYRSRYGHPAPDVVARYAARGIAVVRTDHCGAWQWADGRARCTREQRRRYWQWQGADRPLTPGRIAPSSPPPPPPSKP